MLLLELFEAKYRPLWPPNGLNLHALLDSKWKNLIFTESKIFKVIGRMSFNILFDLHWLCNDLF